jgi:hypothetical protein
MKTMDIILPPRSTHHFFLSTLHWKEAKPNKDYGPFGCADKSAEKYWWLICCERKILFRLKKTS